MPWNKDYIGQALAGFGAGVQGRGPQFLEQLDEKRKEALMKDAFRVQQLLTANNPLEAQTLLEQRVEHIGRLGGDPSDTLGVLNKLKKGDTEGALSDVSTAVELGTRMGYLKPPNYGQNTGQVSAPKKVIGTTASGKKLNGSVIVKYDSQTQKAVPEFLPDVGAIDPNDPIVSTQNVDAAGLAGADRIDLQADARERLERLETEELATRTATEKKIIRNTDFINESMTVAEQVPILRRAIDLLQEVETGNVQGAMQWAKQKFGIQTADEAELSNLLSTNVLKQLRPTFGNQFTKNEGDWLKAIEPNLGKSSKGNLRILQQVEARITRRLKQGMKYAQNEDTYDEDAYNYINQHLKGGFDATDPEEPKAPAGPAAAPASMDFSTIPGFDKLSPAEQEELKALLVRQVQGGG